MGTLSTQKDQQWPVPVLANPLVSSDLFNFKSTLVKKQFGKTVEILFRCQLLCQAVNFSLILAQTYFYLLYTRSIYHISV